MALATGIPRMRPVTQRGVGNDILDTTPHQQYVGPVHRHLCSQTPLAFLENDDRLLVRIVWYRHDRAEDLMRWWKWVLVAIIVVSWSYGLYLNLFELPGSIG